MLREHLGHGVRKVRLASKLGLRAYQLAKCSALKTSQGLRFILSRMIRSGVTGTLHVVDGGLIAASEYDFSVVGPRLKHRRRKSTQDVEHANCST